MKYNRIESIGFSNQNSEVFKVVPAGDQNVTFELPIVEKKEIVGFVNSIREKQTNSAGVVERANSLAKIVETLLSRKSEIVDAVCLETGKAKKLAEVEFNVAVEFMLALAGLAKFSTGAVIPSINPRKTGIYERVPYGVAALIASYNTPLPNYAWKVAPSYLVGNVSILKPSPFTPMSAKLFVECFEKVLGEKNSVFLLLGDAEQGEYLVASKPDLISFTGSFNTGLKIQEQVKDYCPKVILELGGNNAFIVFSDANVDESVETAFQSAYSNSGQRCAAGSRIFVERSISEDFLSKLRKRVIVAAAGFGSNFEIGPVINISSYKKLDDFLNKCRLEGLPVHQNGMSDEAKLLFNPALVEIPLENICMMEDELFGPIARVIAFDSEEEVVNLVNSTRSSLTAAVWTKNIDRAFRVSRSIRSGIVNINGPTHGAEFQFPFGGFENSGNGSKEVGYQCLEQYSFSKLTTITYDG